MSPTDQKIVYALQFGIIVLSFALAAIHSGLI